MLLDGRLKQVGGENSIQRQWRREFHPTAMAEKTPSNGDGGENSSTCSPHRSIQRRWTTTEKLTPTLFCSLASGI